MNSRRTRLTPHTYLKESDSWLGGMHRVLAEKRFGETLETMLLNIDWRIDKKGYHIPVLQIYPVTLDGDDEIVEVNMGTLFNVIESDIRINDTIEIGMTKNIIEYPDNPNKFEIGDEDVMLLKNIITEHRKEERDIQYPIIPDKCICCNGKLTDSLKCTSITCKEIIIESDIGQKLVGI